MNKNESLPVTKNSIYYCNNQKVVVLKKYEGVHMVKVRNLLTSEEFIIDKNALSYELISEMTISLALLGGI